MRINDLASVMRSQGMTIQWVSVWEAASKSFIAEDCSAEYVIKHYGNMEIKRISAENSTIIIYV